MYGYHLIKFLGVLVRWITLNILFIFFFRRKRISFKDVWLGINIKAPIFGITNGLTNVLLGFIVLFIICLLLYL